MTKKELIDMYARSRKSGKGILEARAEAEADLNCILDIITDTVANGEKVAISKFGTFKRKNCPVKSCFNPRTGEMMTNPAHKHVTFTVSSLVDAKANK